MSLLNSSLSPTTFRGILPNIRRPSISSRRWTHLQQSSAAYHISSVTSRLLLSPLKTYFFELDCCRAREVTLSFMDTLIALTYLLTYCYVSFLEEGRENQCHDPWSGDVKLQLKFPTILLTHNFQTEANKANKTSRRLSSEHGKSVWKLERTQITHKNLWLVCTTVQFQHWVENVETPNAHNTCSRNRRRKPAPENWCHKPTWK